MAVLGYLPKLKRDLGLAFGTHFRHDFSIKMFLINTLSVDKVLMRYLFSFEYLENEKSFLDEIKNIFHS